MLSGSLIYIRQLDITVTQREDSENNVNSLKYTVLRITMYMCTMYYLYRHSFCVGKKTTFLTSPCCLTVAKAVSNKSQLSQSTIILQHQLQSSSNLGWTNTMDGGRKAAGSAGRQKPVFPGRVQLLTQKEDLRKLQSAQKNIL